MVEKLEQKQNYNKNPKTKFLPSFLEKCNSTGGGM